jgi:hypothetical protein
MKYDFIIGIDPDIINSGIAILNTSNKEIELYSKRFPLAIELLKLFCEKHLNICSSRPNLMIVVEAGWKVKKSNYHKINGIPGEKISKDVGSNHIAGKLIIEMLEYYKIPVVEHYPLKKLWKGPKGKITHEEISNFMKFPKRSNQEVRDAALLAWCYADFPIIIK